MGILCKWDSWALHIFKLRGYCSNYYQWYLWRWEALCIISVSSLSACSSFDFRARASTATSHNPFIAFRSALFVPLRNFVVVGLSITPFRPKDFLSTWACLLPVEYSAWWNKYNPSVYIVTFGYLHGKQIAHRLTDLKGWTFSEAAVSLHFFFFKICFRSLRA